MMASEAILLSQRLANRDDGGDRDRALVDLVDHVTEPLRRYVMAHAPYEQVEEICAETWKIMLEHVKTGTYEDRKADPISYMIGIAYYVSLRYGSRWQRAQAHELLFDETNEPAIEEAKIDIERQLDLASLDHILTDPEDLAVLQALRADQTIAEMADAWHCHYKTAWRRYHKFLERSRAVLSDGTIPA